MSAVRQCRFQLIRYVPDPVKNEFVNIGVVLRGDEPSFDQSVVRFTRDWSRVRCLDPDVDTQMLEALESEVNERLRNPVVASAQKPILDRFEDTLSNCLQITESKGYLAETFLAGVETLMRMYVDNPPREKTKRRGGRSAVLAAMRSQFEEAGVWGMMFKNVAAAQYTEAGDPLRIDCGYSNGVVKMFQAISLETDVVDAKLLALSAAGLREGVARIAQKELLLSAVVEPIHWPEGEAEPSEDNKERYDYAVKTMEKHKVRVFTTARLRDLADEARRELKV